MSTDETMRMIRVNRFAYFATLLLLMWNSRLDTEAYNYLKGRCDDTQYKLEHMDIEVILVPERQQHNQEPDAPEPIPEPQNEQNNMPDPWRIRKRRLQDATAQCPYGIHGGKAKAIHV